MGRAPSGLTQRLLTCLGVRGAVPWVGVSPAVSVGWGSGEGWRRVTRVAARGEGREQSAGPGPGCCSWSPLPPHWPLGSLHSLSGQDALSLLPRGSQQPGRSTFKAQIWYHFVPCAPGPAAEGGPPIARPALLMCCHMSHVPASCWTGHSASRGAESQVPVLMGTPSREGTEAN